MRTTLQIDDDVLLAARQLAREQGVSVGKAMSALARQALTRTAPCTTRDGIPQFPVRPDAGIVTLELVNQLRDELP